MNETREEKQTRGYLNDGFTFNDIYFKPMTLRTLLLLERIKSSYYTGIGDPLKGLIDFLYISSTDSKTINKEIMADNYESALMDFAEQFSVDDLNKLSKMVENDSTDITSALVEVIETVDTKKK